MIYIFKVIISAILITAATEVAKRSPTIGGLIASLPLTSLLVIIWLYIDTKDVQKIQSLSYGILWMIIPSLALFISLPLMLKAGWRFDLSLGASCAITCLCYWVFTFALAKFGS